MPLRTALASLVLAALPIGAQVPGMTGTLVVTNKAPSTATLVDVASGAVLATLPTGNGPHEVVAARDGRIAVVTDYGTGPAPGSTLTVIDVPGRRIARTIALGAYRRPHGIAFLPGDSVVAVTVEASQAVLLVDVTRGEVLRAVGTEKAGSHMVGVTADGRRAWTGDIGSNTVTELDLVAGRALRAIAVPAQPEAINVTPDGAEVWVGSNAERIVSAISTATAAVATAADGFGWPYRVLFTPDAALVVLPDYRGDAVRVVERATRRELGRLDFPGAGPQGITLAADGRVAFLSLSNEARVVAIELATRRVIGAVPAGDTPDGIAYSRVVVPR